MKVKRIIENNGLIVTYFGGKHTYKDATAALDELLLINAANRSIYEIVVNSDDIELTFSKKERELLSVEVGKVFSKFDRGALAVVANRDLVFGYSRMLQVAIANAKIAVSVFRSETLARKWIHELMELHNK